MPNIKLRDMLCRLSPTRFVLTICKPNLSSMYEFLAYAISTLALIALLRSTFIGPRQAKWQLLT